MPLSYRHSDASAASSHHIDSISKDYSAVRLLQELHQDDTWRWLCKFHHHCMGVL